MKTKNGSRQKPVSSKITETKKKKEEKHHPQKQQMFCWSSFNPIKRDKRNDREDFNVFQIRVLSTWFLCLQAR